MGSSWSGAGGRIVALAREGGSPRRGALTGGTGFATAGAQSGLKEAPPRPSEEQLREMTEGALRSSDPPGRLLALLG
jgi:hypothetical protein